MAAAMAKLTAVDTLTLPIIRSSTARWEMLQGLLTHVGRLAQAALLIDLMGLHSSHAVAEAAMFEEGIALLQATIDRELSRLTCEGLRAELAQQQRKDRR